MKIAEQTLWALTITSSEHFVGPYEPVWYIPNFRASQGKLWERREQRKLAHMWLRVQNRIHDTQWKGMECSNHRVNPTLVLYSSHIFVFLFLSEDKLYVIMELVEGAPLGEHFNSLKEKGTRFSEERIWHIFIQVPCLDFLLKIFILYRTF